VEAERKTRGNLLRLVLRQDEGVSFLVFLNHLNGQGGLDERVGVAAVVLPGTDAALGGGTEARVGLGAGALGEVVAGSLRRAHSLGDGGVQGGQTDANLLLLLLLHLGDDCGPLLVLGSSSGDRAGGASTRGSTLELGRILVNVQGVDETTPLTTVAHAVVEVVGAVRERLGLGVVALEGTTGGKDHLGGDELRRSTVVGGHDGKGLTGGEALMLDVGQAAVGVVHVDRLDLELGSGHVDVDELAALTHGAGAAVAGIVLAAQDKAADLQVCGGHVVHGGQGDGDQVLELGVVDGEGGLGSSGVGGRHGNLLVFLLLVGFWWLLREFSSNKVQKL